jgi:putative oxidoreductase
MKNWLEVFRTNDSFAPLFLRLIMAVVMFPHGAQKVFGWFGGRGYEATVTGFVGMGIPQILAILVVVVEFLGPILLVFGLLTRFAAAGIGTIMIVAALMVHLPHGFFMNWSGQKGGEGIEFHLLMLAIAIALIIQGGGKWALDALIYRKFSRHEPGEVPLLKPSPRPA